MSIFILLFGALTGSFLSVLIGFLGSSRRIGFSWAFIASLLLTPFIGLIITLLSDPLPYNAPNRWGCLPMIFGIIGFLMLIPILLFGLPALLALLGLSVAAVA